MAEGHESQSSTPSSDQDSADKKTQVPTVGGLKSQNGNVPMFSIMFPALVPGLFPPQPDPEQMNRGPGLYAVSVLPFMQPITGFPSNIRTEGSLPETREMRGEQVQGVEQQQQEAGLQRQVVVQRFQIAIHIDVMLILKLAAVIFLFNQDGSRQRLTLLVFLASLVYLYETGALAPVIWWLSQGMRRAAASPQPPRADVQADNIPAGAAHGNENAGMAEEQLEGEDENRHANDGNRVIENENAAEAGQGEVANRWWVIVKEIQMIVFGCVWFYYFTSPCLSQCRLGCQVWRAQNAGQVTYLGYTGTSVYTNMFYCMRAEYISFSCNVFSFFCFCFLFLFWYEDILL